MYYSELPPYLRNQRIQGKSGKFVFNQGKSGEKKDFLKIRKSAFLVKVQPNLDKVFILYYSIL